MKKNPSLLVLCATDIFCVLSGPLFFRNLSDEGCEIVRLFSWLTR